MNLYAAKMGFGSKKPDATWQARRDRQRKRKARSRNTAAERKTEADAAKAAALSRFYKDTEYFRHGEYGRFKKHAGRFNRSKDLTWFVKKYCTEWDPHPGAGRQQHRCLPDTCQERGCNKSSESMYAYCEDHRRDHTNPATLRDGSKELPAAPKEWYSAGPANGFMANGAPNTRAAGGFGGIFDKKCAKAGCQKPAMDGPDALGKKTFCLTHQKERERYTGTTSPYAPHCAREQERFLFHGQRSPLRPCWHFVHKFCHKPHNRIGQPRQGVPAGDPARRRTMCSCIQPPNEWVEAGGLASGPAS